MTRPACGPCAPMPPMRFRARIKPYLPGSILMVRRLWPRARKQRYEKGSRLLVGPYCPSCGPDILWLFRPDGAMEMTADRDWVERHFELVHDSRTRRLYTFPLPWPPRPGAA